MGDFDNLRTNGNAEQKHALIEAAKAVKQYCAPEIAKEMEKRTTGFVFSSKVPENVGGRYMKIEGQDIVILPADRFVKKDPESQEEVICHELAHSKWRNEKNNPYYMGSKENELQAYTTQFYSKEKYEADKYPVIHKIRKVLGMSSRPKEEIQKEITEKLNKSSLYKCLPEKEPKTKAEYDKAVYEYKLCKKRMEKNEKEDFLSKLFKK